MDRAEIGRISRQAFSNGFAAADLDVKLLTCGCALASRRDARWNYRYGRISPSTKPMAIRLREVGVAGLLAVGVGSLGDVVGAVVQVCDGDVFGVGGAGCL